MRRMSAAAAVVVGTVLLAPQPASAASKEQQLLMAELRIMQQNQQQLAQSLLALAESLKTVTGRLDEQSATSRKALADQRLLIEGMTDTVRNLREKSDDTNVRLSSITQELESIRQTISSLPQPAAATTASTTAALPMLRLALIIATPPSCEWVPACSLPSRFEGMMRNRPGSRYRRRREDGGRFWRGGV